MGNMYVISYCYKYVIIFITTDNKSVKYNYELINMIENTKD